MSKRKDDTPEEINPSGGQEERAPGSYYYDDSTGYEVYDPEKEDEDEEGDAYRPEGDAARRS
ncbi:MAG TPA: hypothetical protein VJT09_10675 [Pyrinomonadaceae bacterium]|nr:hypothetical protein [Pyrinomonadaceae bacterium]